MVKKIVFTLFMLSLTLNLFAQGSQVEMADTFRSEGKIYVVVGCIVLILVSLLVYLFSLDRRLKMLEKKSANKI